MGVCGPQHFQHGAPVPQHPLPGSCIGGDAAAVLIPDGQAVVPGDAYPLHREQPQREILAQPHMAGHLIQRREEKFPLIHNPCTTDAVIVEQQVPADGLGVVVGGVVGRAVKGGFPRGRLWGRAGGEVGLLAESHAGAIGLQPAQPPGNRLTVIEEVSRREHEHPAGGGGAQGVLGVFYGAAVGDQLGGLHIGDAVGRQVGAALGKIVLL